MATINPEAGQTEESLSTCRFVFICILLSTLQHVSKYDVNASFSRFAQRVSLIKNKATINENMDPDAVIRRLKSEILMLREEISFLKVRPCNLIASHKN